MLSGKSFSHSVLIFCFLQNIKHLNMSYKAAYGKYHCALEELKEALKNLENH